MDPKYISKKKKLLVFFANGTLKILNIKLPHSFNFCGISVTFILIYCMSFSENLFYSVSLLYYSFKQRLQLQATFIVPHTENDV